MEILVAKGSSSGRSHTVPPAWLARHAARLSLVAGLILLIGVVVDLGTLWVLQNQPSVQWEFVALGTTTNAYPLLLLGAVLIYLSLVMGQSDSLVAYRAVAGLVFAMGLMGLVVLLLIVTNYFALVKQAGLPEDAIPFFRSVLIKSGGLSALYALCLVPVGLLGLRIPKSAG